MYQQDLGKNMFNLGCFAALFALVSLCTMNFSLTAGGCCAQPFSTFSADFLRLKKSRTVFSNGKNVRLCATQAGDLNPFLKPISIN
jgi:hypothetical protein